VTGREHERLANLDAAYAMDALEPAERAQFEAHLHACGECRARVSEHRDTLALLSGVAVSAAAHDPVPETMLPALLRRVSRDRLRRRVLTGAGAAVAAACILTLVVVFLPGSTGGHAPRPGPAAAQDFVPMTKTPVHANASLVSTSWGTQIDVHCTYAIGVSQPDPYRLRVIDMDGVVDDLGSWSLPIDKDVSYVAGTSLDLSHIRAVQIVRSDGTPILALTPP